TAQISCQHAPCRQDGGLSRHNDAEMIRLLVRNNEDDVVGLRGPGTAEVCCALSFSAGSHMKAATPTRTTPLRSRTYLTVRLIVGSHPDRKAHPPRWSGPSCPEDLDT